MKDEMENLELRRSKLTLEQRELLEKRLRGMKDDTRRSIPRRPQGSRIPLTFAQERMWNSHRVPISSAIHNAPSALRVRGRLDTDALEQALNQIIQRHESLRHVFPREGVPEQLVQEEARIQLPVKVFPNLDESARQALTVAAAGEEARRPFDLAAAPLLRAFVIRFDDDDHAIFLTLHHVVFDGWSKGVLIRELLTLYQAAVAGHNADLPALGIQYADFAIWQRNAYSCGTLAPHLRYWKEELAGARNFELPPDYPRPALRSFDGSRRWLRFQPELSGAINNLAETYGVTLFIVTIAAWVELLRRCTGETDILIGSAVAGRTHTETEPLIGFFVNYLPLRFRLSGCRSFQDLIANCSRVCLNAYDHQDAPLQTIVQEIGIVPDESRHPLFQTAFTFHNTFIPSIRLPGLESTLIEFDDHLIRLDLEMDLWWREDALEGFIVHNTALYKEETIGRLIADYENLLGELATSGGFEMT